MTDPDEERLRAVGKVLLWVLLGIAALVSVVVVVFVVGSVVMIGLVAYTCGKH
jgi:hypothetical protein